MSAKRASVAKMRGRPRSGRQNKAWGASPRLGVQKMRVEPAKRATALNRKRCRPLRGLRALLINADLGLAPQALFCHLLRRFRANSFRVTCSAGSAHNTFTLPASQVPGATCLRHLLRRLSAPQAQTKVDAGGQVGKVDQRVAVALFLLDGGVTVALVV